MGKSMRQNALHEKRGVNLSGKMLSSAKEEQIHAANCSRQRKRSKFTRQTALASERGANSHGKLLSTSGVG